VQIVQSKPTSTFRGRRIAPPASRSSTPGPDRSRTGKPRRGLPPSRVPVRPLPGQLRDGLEAASGIDMADVRVHRDAPEPAGVGALAFTRGHDVFLAPHQEHLLPHEAWHVVQQKQRRVPASSELPGGQAVNTDPELEQEAHSLGAAAARDGGRAATDTARRVANPDGPLQGVFLLTDRPHDEIEAEQRARARRPFLAGAGPIGQLPLQIALPPAPLALTDRPHAEIEAERKRNEANEQLGLGRYKDPGTARFEGEALAAPTDLERLVRADAKASALAAVGRYKVARDALDPVSFQEWNNSQLAKKVAEAAAMSSKQATTEAWFALEQQATEALRRVDELKRAAYTRRSSDPKALARFRQSIALVQNTSQKLLDSLTKKDSKRKAIAGLQSRLRDLEIATSKGVSKADNELLNKIGKELDAVAPGKAVKPEATLAGTARDPDDDNRQGTEPTLSYRNETYYKIPGFANPPVYGRIVNPGLSQDALNAYQAALIKGKIAPNEKGESGVKEKPLHYEIKLLADRAAQLGVGRTTRLIPKGGEVNQVTSARVGIRYVVFNRTYDAHV